MIIIIMVEFIIFLVVGIVVLICFFYCCFSFISGPKQCWEDCKTGEHCNILCNCQDCSAPGSSE